MKQTCLGLEVAAVIFHDFFHEFVDFEGRGGALFVVIGVVSVCIT